MKQETKKLLSLFNMAEADRRFGVAHGTVAKAIKEEGRAGIGYAEALRDIDAHENVRDYKAVVMEKLNKREKKSKT